MKTKTYIITGATSGIGDALIRHLAQDNIVFAGYRDKSKLEKLTEISTNIYPFYIDYAKPETIKLAADYLKSKCTKVDTLVNLPLAVNLSFYSALIPEITAAISKKDFKSASKKISFSISSSLLILIPCAIGFIVLADPILKMLYPNASDGAHILQIAAVTMVFVGINHTIQGSLFGLGKMYTPALALLIGCVIKIGLNLVLITNPNINIYGAVISSFIFVKKIKAQDKKIKELSENIEELKHSKGE